MAQTSFKIIAVLALILGLGSIGWMTYTQFFLPDEPRTPTSRQYYDLDNSLVFTSSDGSYANNDDLLINYTINSGEKVYFSYVCTAVIDDNSRPDTEIWFFFEIDGIRWTNPYQRIRRWNENDPDGADIRWISVALQHYNATMTPGEHNCSVAIYFYDSLDRVWQQSLFIEVYS